MSKYKHIGFACAFCGDPVIEDVMALWVVPDAELREDQRRQEQQIWCHPACLLMKAVEPVKSCLVFNMPDDVIDGLWGNEDIVLEPSETVEDVIAALERLGKDAEEELNPPEEGE